MRRRAALAVAGVALAAGVWAIERVGRRSGATRTEARMPLPGDGIVLDRRCGHA